MRSRNLLFILLAFAFVGCASAPQRGVRVAFKGDKVATVAVAPIWSATRFGMSDDEWRTFTRRVERQLASELEGLGFRVVGPEGLRDRLERRNLWDRFLDVISFRDGIERHFEPSLYDKPPLEVVALEELHAVGAIGADTLLVSELVYHSRAECVADPREFSHFAVVVTPAGAAPKRLEPGPCIVTHFHAKLVDAETGRTMWQNRQLREYRDDEIAEAEERDNVSSVISSTVAGAHGLAPFSPNPGAAALASD